MTTAPSKKHSTTFRPRMRKLSEFVYLVESSLLPGTGHKVDIASGRCGCTAGSYGRRCHHLALAEQMDRAVEALRAQAEQQRATARQEKAEAVPAILPEPPKVVGMGDELAAAEQQLAIKRRALADTHPQSDEFAVLLHAVDQAERAVAALDARAMRAA